jgi:hypothetical protein
VGEAGAAVFLDPAERQVDAGRNAGAGVDVAVLDPQRLVLDPDTRMPRRQLAAELPVRGRATAIQQAGLGQQERPDTHRAQPPHVGCLLTQPRGQRRIAE